MAHIELKKQAATAYTNAADVIEKLDKRGFKQAFPEEAADENGRQELLGELRGIAAQAWLEVGDAYFEALEKKREARRKLLKE